MTERGGGQSLIFPKECVTADALKGLAQLLDRIAKFSGEHPEGGHRHGPCLTELIVSNGTVTARIEWGGRTYRLKLVRGNWEFR